MFRPPVRTLYLDFQTHLYDLGGRNSEIRGREICVEVHHGEQGFSTDSHAGCLAAAGDYHHAPEIIRDFLMNDALKFRLDAGELQSIHHVRCFHEVEMHEDAGDANADWHHPDAVLRQRAVLMEAISSTR